MLSDVEGEISSQIFSLTPLPLSRFLTKENLFKVELIPIDPRTMNPSDLETLHRMVKKKKTSTTVAPKCAWIETVLVQPVIGGSSRAANALRKEKSASAKVVTPIRSAAPRESVRRPSTSSFKRSSGGPKISIRMSDCGPNILESVSPVEVFLDTEDKRKGIGDYHLIHHVDHFIEVIREVRHLSKKIEEKAVQAHRRADDAQLSRLKIEEETRSLRKRVKQLESKLTKTEAQVLGEREAGKARAEAARIKAVEAFRALKEFHNIKMDFALLSYLQGGIDLKEKVQNVSRL
ncbi:hypothetical protein COCNU_03G011000 [Cocos nucifera]|uniref:Uncharacterized protein n=1 Tax=Cocos nucifera TaxID=13894 RepID=A0A8K0I3R1_COCNU|nr:hypothetical protein COCNU_03G011000 [Cocos nucifera]